MPVENCPVNLVVQGGHVQDNTLLQLSITSCLCCLTEHRMSETKHTPCTTIGFIPCFDVCQMVTNRQTQSFTEDSTSLLYLLDELVF